MTDTHYAALTDALEQQTIDVSAFRHRDHVGVACEMLRRYPYLDAAVRYADAIKGVATKAGVPEKFNLTITLAFLSMIAERMATVPHDSVADFIDRNPDLLTKQVLERWYAPSRLTSALARDVFLMPDNGAVSGEGA